MLDTFHRFDTVQCSPLATFQKTACLSSSITTLNKSDNVCLLSVILGAIYVKQLIWQQITLITPDLAEIPKVLKPCLIKRLNGFFVETE